MLSAVQLIQVLALSSITRAQLVMACPHRYNNADLQVGLGLVNAYVGITQSLVQGGWATEMDLPDERDAR
jgi:hypothetical protein